MLISYIENLPPLSTRGISLSSFPRQPPKSFGRERVAVAVEAVEVEVPAQEVRAQEVLARVARAVQAAPAVLVVEPAEVQVRDPQVLAAEELAGKQTYFVIGRAQSRLSFPMTVYIDSSTLYNSRKRARLLFINPIPLV
jgi:hypothetical protein